SRQRLESDGSYIDLPGTRLRGEGWFDPNDSQMRLVMDTRRLPDIDTLSQLVWRAFPRLPLRLGGSASAEAEWTGGIRQARLAGNFRVRDFAYQNSSWDQFTGRLEYRRLPGVGEAAEAAAAGAPTVAATLTIRSGELSKATAQISFDLQLGLGAGGHGSHSPFTVRGRIRNTPLEELQRLAGTDYPLRGVVQGSFEASGTRQNPAGRGSLTVSDGTLYEEPFERLNAVLRLDGGGVWTAESIRAEKSGGFVHGSGAFHQRTRQLQFDLTGSGISLASFRTLQRASKRLTGIAEGRLSGSGDIKRPRLRGEIRLREFGFGLAEPGNLTLDMESRDGSAHWTVVGQMWNGQVQASGDTRLEEPFPTAAEIDFQNLDLPPLLRAFREPPRDLAGRFSGKARLQGNAQNWGGITLRGELAELAGSFRQVQVRSRGPVPFRYENRRIYLEQLHLAGPGAELEAAGAIVLAADPALHLTAQGRMDLAGLSPEDSDLALAGQVQLDAQIGGTIRQPLWRGRLFVTDASVHYGDFPNGLDHINGRVVFEGARGILEDMTAESGSGQVRLSGFVRYGGAEDWQFHLTAEGTSIRVRYPEGLSTWVNGSVNWTGSLQSSLLEGRIVLTRQSVSPQFDLVPVLLRGREEPAPADLPEVLRNLRLSLEVTSAADLRLDTLTTRNLQTDVALRMQGTVAQPAWLGRIGILGGEILFAGKRYNVNRGEISFVNPFRFEPILSLSVQARVQRYDIAMDFSGPPDRLTVTYRSDPPLPTSDILALLVAGRARETSLETSPNQPLPEVSADALLSQALQSQIGSRLDRLFGSGRVRLDPQISGLGRSANASVALEQQLGEDISVLYITDVTSTQQQTIQAEWNISPKLSVVAIRDQNGLIGVNFQITLRFR
ncbi:MAG TPA: translocation/assembly module TamB domain-containing protein, partial [Terriglobia bacterium]|nr:translocation/assembly module TamB domain-containing protein [Terriglobia bacterium]